MAASKPQNEPYATTTNAHHDFPMTLTYSHRVTNAFHINEIIRLILRQMQKLDYL